MTPRERLFAAVASASVDRRPWLPVLSLYGARHHACPLDRYYADAAAYARGQQANVDAFAPDVVFAPVALALIAEAFGCRLHQHADQAPTVATPITALRVDRAPDPEHHPRIAFLHDAVRAMAQAMPGGTPIAAIVPAPTDLPALVLGIEGWLEIITGAESGWRQMLDTTAAWTIRFINAQFAAGTDVAVMPLGMLSATVVPRVVAQRMLSALRATLAAVTGPVVLHHAGAPLLPHLDLLLGLPHVVGFSLDHRDDAGAARRVVGAGPLLVAGIDGPGLLRSDPAAITGAVQAAMACCRGDPAIAVGMSGPDVPINTPPGNILSFRDAVATGGM